MKAVFQWLSPCGANARLPVFIFHRVHREADPLFPGEMTAQHFDAVCRWLASWFHVLPLDRAVHQLRQNALPARAAGITFDDGYADNHGVALPILQRHSLCATFFIATGFLDGGRMWNDTIIEVVRRAQGDTIDLQDFGLDGQFPIGSLEQRRKALEQAIGAAKYMEHSARLQAVVRFATRFGRDLPDNLMMSTQQVRAMHAAGMQMGAHTDTHPILATMDVDDARQEIQRGRDRLQGILDSPVELFAYPNGRPGTDYLPAHAALVRDMAFDAAFTTAWGVAHAGSDLNELPRFSPWDRNRWSYGLRVAQQMWRTRRHAP